MLRVKVGDIKRERNIVVFRDSILTITYHTRTLMMDKNRNSIISGGSESNEAERV